MDPGLNSTQADEGTKHAHLFTFAGANKAGMESVDKKRQAQIIYDMSKDSAFYKRQVEQDEKVNKKVEAMRSKLRSMSEAQRQGFAKISMARVYQVESKRTFSRICSVLDMDMFFAAVEIRDQPHLKDKPVAVGGMGMISTTNYVARKYGVRAAMPGFIGKKLCPELIFVRPNFDKYSAVAEIIRTVVREYDPHFKSHSLDEVYMDLTDAARKRVIQMRGTSDSNGTGSEIPSSSSPSSVPEGRNDGIPNTDATMMSKPAIYSDLHSSVHSSSEAYCKESLAMKNDQTEYQAERPERVHGAANKDNILFDSSYLKQTKLTVIVSNPATATRAASSSSASVSGGGSLCETSLLEGGGSRSAGTGGIQAHGGTTLPVTMIPIEELRAAACVVLQEIRDKITVATGGLTCSAGIANNFMLAKICADENKPNGQFELKASRDAVMAFVDNLPTRKVGGIGKVNEKILSALDMHTMRDVRANLNNIISSFTPAFASFLVRASLGLGSEEVEGGGGEQAGSSGNSSGGDRGGGGMSLATGGDINSGGKASGGMKQLPLDKMLFLSSKATLPSSPSVMGAEVVVDNVSGNTAPYCASALVDRSPSLSRGSDNGTGIAGSDIVAVVADAAAAAPKDHKDIGRKSLGSERTFSMCCDSLTEQRQKLKELCDNVCSDMKQEGIVAQTVTLKVKTTKFELLTRSSTSRSFFQSADVINRMAQALLTSVSPVQIRLIGVQVSKFKLYQQQEEKKEQKKCKEGNNSERDDNERRTVVGDDGHVNQQPLNQHKGEVPHSNYDHIMMFAKEEGELKENISMSKNNSNRDNHDGNTNEVRNRCGTTSTSSTNDKTLYRYIIQHTAHDDHDDSTSGTATASDDDNLQYHSCLAAAAWSSGGGTQNGVLTQSSSLKRPASPPPLKQQQPMQKQRSGLNSWIDQKDRTSGDRGSNEAAVAATAAMGSLLSHKRIYSCPICDKRINGTVVELNKHIDECLLVGSAIPVPVSTGALGMHHRGYIGIDRRNETSQRPRGSHSDGIINHGVYAYADTEYERAILASLRDCEKKAEAGEVNNDKDHHHNHTDDRDSGRDNVSLGALMAAQIQAQEGAEHQMHIICPLTSMHTHETKAGKRVAVAAVAAAVATGSGSGSTSSKSASSSNRITQFLVRQHPSK